MLYDSHSDVHPAEPYVHSTKVYYESHEANGAAIHPTTATVQSSLYHLIVLKSSSTACILLQRHEYCPGAACLHSKVATVANDDAFFLLQLWAEYIRNSDYSAIVDGDT